MNTSMLAELARRELAMPSSRDEVSPVARNTTSAYALTAPSELRSGEAGSGLPIENYTLYNLPLAGKVARL